MGMLRRLAAPLLLLLLAGLLISGAAGGEMRQKGNLRITFAGGFAPHALPRDRLAPVTVDVEGRVDMVDGSHPPALRHIEIALNSKGRITTEGLPTCRPAVLQSATTQLALARCRGALVGHGSFAADLRAGEAPVPTSGQILIFNSTQDGKPSLLLHLYGTVPVRAAFVLPLVIGHRDSQFGTVLSTAVPRLGGGIGSVTEIALKLGRQYTYKGQRRSYLSASCPAPAGFRLAPFPFARGSFQFADGTKISTSLSRDCAVR